jgi:hypothetical protein
MQRPISGHEFFFEKVNKFGGFFTAKTVSLRRPKDALRKKIGTTGGHNEFRDDWPGRRYCGRDTGVLF